MASVPRASSSASLASSGRSLIRPTQPPRGKPSSPAGSSMTPSSETLSLTTIFPISLSSVFGTRGPLGAARATPHRSRLRGWGCAPHVQASIRAGSRAVTLTGDAARSQHSGFALRLKFGHDRRLASRDGSGLHGLSALRALQHVSHATAAPVLVDDGCTISRGPAITPLRKGDDHRHEVESLLRQVVGLASIPLVPGLHES